MTCPSNSVGTSTGDGPVKSTSTGASSSRSEDHPAVSPVFCPSTACAGFPSCWAISGDTGADAADATWAIEVSGTFRLDGATRGKRGDGDGKLLARTPVSAEADARGDPDEDSAASQASANTGTVEAERD